MMAETNGDAHTNGAAPTNGVAAANGFHATSIDPAVERERLELELEAARLRLSDARARALAREAASIEALRDAVASSRVALSELERQHDEALTQLLIATQEEAARILADARAVAATLTAGTTADQSAVHDVE